MTIDELWQRIEQAGEQHNYALNDVPRPPGGGLPSSVTVVEPVEDGRWTVYFTERGAIIGPRFYADEDAACRSVARRLRRRP